ncbi:hypothetical protein PPERSA_11209 [Pseudocohnilembus persalinus]|uniref:Uncharacterized protein n=1 Tax=Pseudocohnilembus persalinus TaxID=266149 RepID=A0A0V0QZB3_PSEPJ|nr:hypothetical protein PPERSA_11209 [Pseudocohnilembus persalinus]|eukprot:KRX07660.1 hypothetical protein PPERSA_11209 [Pseudocohnilembus persalinus]
MKNKEIKVIYTVWVIITVVIYLVFSIIMYKKFDNLSDEYEKLVENWEKGPITEIEFISENEKCTSNYSETLLSFQPNKMVHGCDCFTGGIDKGYCCYDSDPSECDTCYGIEISGIDKDEINVFKKWNNGKTQNFRICSKSIKNYEFMKKAPLQEDFTCLNNEKKCGNTYCINEDEYCPITSLNVSDNLPSVLSNIFPNAGVAESTVDIDSAGFGKKFENEKGGYIKYYTGNSIDNTKYSFFYWIREENGKLPLVEGKPEEGNGVCLDSDDNNYSPGFRKYPLESPERKECKVDDRYISVGLSIDQKTYYDINDQNVFKDLPDYYDEYITSHIDYTLYQRNQIYLGYNCRQDLHLYQQNEEDFKAVSTTLLILLIFICILSILCKKKDKKNGVIITIIVIKFVLLLMVLGIIMASYFTFYVQQQFIDGQINKGCLDKQTQYLFEHTNEHLNSGFLNTLAGYSYYKLFKKIKKCCKKGLKCQNDSKKPKKYKFNKDNQDDDKMKYANKVDLMLKQQNKKQQQDMDETPVQPNYQQQFNNNKDNHNNFIPNNPMID